MTKKSVGIITLPGQFNYGNRLQCFAMSEAVRRAGFDPAVLERNRQFGLFRTFGRAVKRYLLKASGEETLNERRSTEERSEAFKRFGRRIPTVTLPGFGYRQASCYYRLILGSDQVWNPDYIAHQEKWYFAAFARPEKCVAVAASLGIDRFASNEQSRRIARGIKGVSRISVRERRGAELVKECSGIDARVVCDPTFALTAEEWRSVADDRCTPQEPYVFTYLLGGVGSESSDVLEIVTDHGRISVVQLTDNQKPDEPDAGPAEFISLIDQAVHVVTDSFHAAVFSSILQTPLTIVHREGGASMFSRLEQLAEMLGIEEKVYGSPTYDLSRAASFDGVSETIAHERAQFMDYLEDCLNG